MKRILLFTSACLLFLAGSAFAGTSTQALQVSACVVPIVQVSCNPITFGTVVTGQTAHVSAPIFITAPVGVVYSSIELDGGLSPYGGIRRMIGANVGQYLNYELFEDAAETTPWVVGTPKSLAGVVNNGNSIQIDVYARLFTTVNTIPGDYVDTITVTVTY